MIGLDVTNSLWAIRPEVLTEIFAVYAAQRAGEKTDFQAAEAALSRSASNGPKAHSVQDGIAVIPLEGIISKRMGLFPQIFGGTSTQRFQTELATALNDPEVRGIIISIDSPGGDVDGVQGAADAVFAARSQKPICAYVDGQMCSAAYWIGSAASKVYIGSDTDVVGSIGIVTSHIDTSNAEHQRGVKITDIAAGRYKRIASSHAPLSPEGQSAIQDLLDQLYEIFVDSIARNRGTNPETVLSRMADGRVFIGAKAIDAGLVDGKLTLRILIERMSSRNQRVHATPHQSVQITGATPNLIRAAEPTSTATPTEKSSSGTPDPGVPKLPGSVPATAPTRSAPELRVDKLRDLIEEKRALSRLLKEAQKSEKAASKAVGEAVLAYTDPDKLVPLITAKERAVSTVRILAERLRTNDREQTEVLR